MSTSSSPTGRSPTPNGPTESVPTTNRARMVWSTLGSLGIGAVVIAVLVTAGLPMVPTVASVSRLHAGWSGACIAFAASSATLRASRMRHLLAPVHPTPWREVLAIEWIGQVAAFVLPLRLGEAVRPGLYHLRRGIPLPTAVSMAAVDRILEGLLLVVVLGLAIPLGDPLSPLPHHLARLPIPVAVVPVAAYVAIVAFLTLFGMILAFHGNEPTVTRLLVTALGKVAPRFERRLARALAQMSAGLGFVPSPRHFVPYLLELFGYWVTNALALVCLARATGLEDFGVVRAWAVIGTVGIGLLLPAAPAFVGSYQAAFFAGLALYYDEAVVLATGGTLVALSYALAVLSLLVTGLLAVALDPSTRAAVDLVTHATPPNEPPEPNA